MRRLSKHWTVFALAIGLAIPTLATISVANAKTEPAAAGADKSMSKEDQAKLKEHNKLRSEITRVKYPASKSEVVAHVKGIKADDKKWFEDTLPDRTYSSSDEVMSALGWETTPPAGDESAMNQQQKTHKTGTSPKGEKTVK